MRPRLLYHFASHLKAVRNSPPRQLALSEPGRRDLHRLVGQLRDLRG